MGVLWLVWFTLSKSLYSFEVLDHCLLCANLWKFLLILRSKKNRNMFDKVKLFLLLNGLPWNPENTSPFIPLSINNCWLTVVSVYLNSSIICLTFPRAYIHTILDHSYYQQQVGGGANEGGFAAGWIWRQKMKLYKIMEWTAT